MEEHGSKAQERVACFAACMQSVHTTGHIFEGLVTDLQHVAACNMFKWRCGAVQAMRSS